MQVKVRFFAMATFIVAQLYGVYGDERCNLLNYGSSTSGLSHLEGSFPYRNLKTKIKSFRNSIEVVENFRVNDDIIVLEDRIILLAQISEDEKNTMVSINMPGMKTLHEAQNNLSMFHGGGLSYSLAQEMHRDYLNKDFEEYDVVLRGTLNPRQLSSDGHFVTWTEDCENSETSRCSNVVLHKLSSATTLKIKQFDEFKYIRKSSNGTSFVDSNAEVSGDIVMYQSVNIQTNISSIVMYHIKTQASMMLHVVSHTTSHVNPVLSHSDIYGKTAMWLTVLGAVTIDSYGYTMLTQTQRKAVKINLLYLENSKSETMTSNLWSSGVYDMLQSAHITGSFVLVVLSTSNTDENGNASWILRYRPLRDWHSDTVDVNWTTIGESASYSLLLNSWNHNVLSVTIDGVLKIFILPDSMMLSQLHTNNDGIGSNHNLMKTQCYVDDNLETIKRVYAYNDILVIAYVTTSTSLDDFIYFKLIDLNKDNDLLFDVSDMFPLNEHMMLDLDQDGIGDSYDIINIEWLKIDDITFMFIVWVLYFFAIMAMLFTLFFYYRRTEQRYLDEFETINKEERISEYFSPEEINKLIFEEVQNKIQSHGKGMFAKGKLLAQLFMVVLTFASFVVYVIPYYATENLTSKQIIQLAWLDWFISTVFLIEMIIKFFLREKVFLYCSRNNNYYYGKNEENDEENSDNDVVVDEADSFGVQRNEKKLLKRFYAFLKYNFFDIVSLYTEIPIWFVWYSSAIPFFMRYGFIIKIIRVPRIYLKVVELDVFVTLMLKRPAFFLISFLFIFITISSIIIEILEQGQNDTIGGIHLFENSFWFFIVTVSTVGYGDFHPKSDMARVLSVIAMFIGIGLIGALSSTIGKGVLAVGRSDRTVNQLKLSNRARFDQFYTLMHKLSKPFNPVLASASELFIGSHYIKKGIVDDSQHLDDSKRRFTHFKKKTHIQQSHQRGVPTMIEVCISEACAQKLLKNQRDWLKDTPLYKRANSAVTSNARLQSEVWLDAYLANSGGVIRGDASLSILLRSFFIHNDMKLEEFHELEDHLGQIIFHDPQQNSLYIEKCMSLHHEITFNDSQNVSYSRKRRIVYEMQDPIDMKLHLLEKCLKERGLEKRIDYNIIHRELVVLTLKWDRVQSGLWAIANLAVNDKAYEEEVKAGPPMWLTLNSKVKGNKREKVDSTDAMDISNYVNKSPADFIKAVQSSKQKLAGPSRDTTSYRSSSYQHLFRDDVDFNAVNAFYISDDEIEEDYSDCDEVLDDNDTALL